MLSLMKKFQDDESGATAIEYGLIAALISVGIIAAVSLLGDELNNVFGRISGELGGAVTSSTTTTTTQ